MKSNPKIKLRLLHLSCIRGGNIAETESRRAENEQLIFFFLRNTESKDDNSKSARYGSYSWRGRSETQGSSPRCPCFFSTCFLARCFPVPAISYGSTIWLSNFLWFFCVFYAGNGEEEKLLIRILGHRNATQRKQIREMYQQLYNENLIDRINSEIFGDFKVSC